MKLPRLLSGLLDGVLVREGAMPGARSSLVLLLLINLFNYIDRYVLSAVLPLIGASLFAGHQGEYVDAKLGMLSFAFFVSYMVTAPIFGYLADRAKRWVIVGVGVILWSLASGGSGLAATYGALLVTRIFVGIGEAAYGPAAPTLIADMYPVARRGNVLAWFYMAIPVGSALGYVLGGAIGQEWGWRAAFYAVVPPGLILGALCFLKKDVPRGASEAGHETPTRKRDYRVLWRTPSFVLNTLGMTAMTFALGALSFWMPTYVSKFRGAGELGRVNMIFGAITVATGLSATLLGGVLADRLRPRLAGSYFWVSGVGMLVAFPFSLLMLVTPFPWAWIWVALAEFFIFLNTGPTNTVVANVVPAQVRATAFAVTIFVVHALGDAISPALVGLVSDLTRGPSHPQGNMNAAFLIVSLAIVVGGIFWLLGVRHLERDTARATGGSAP